MKFKVLYNYFILSILLLGSSSIFCSAVRKTNVIQLSSLFAKIISTVLDAKLSTKSIKIPFDHLKKLDDGALYKASTTSISKNPWSTKHSSITTSTTMQIFEVNELKDADWVGEAKILVSVKTDVIQLFNHVYKVIYNDMCYYNQKFTDEKYISWLDYSNYVFCKESVDINFENISEIYAYISARIEDYKSASRFYINEMSQGFIESNLVNSELINAELQNIKSAINYLEHSFKLREAEDVFRFTFSYNEQEFGLDKADLTIIISNKSIDIVFDTIYKSISHLRSKPNMKNDVVNKLESEKIDIVTQYERFTKSSTKFFTKIIF